MNCKFSNRRQRSEELVTIAGKEITQRDHFCYLGTIIHNSREISVNSIKASWLNDKMLRVLCYR